MRIKKMLDKENIGGRSKGRKGRPKIDSESKDEKVMMEGRKKKIKKMN